MSRTERFGIGEKIDTRLLDLMETLRRASYANIRDKIPLLERAIGIVDSARFFLQLAWEMKLISSEQYAAIGNPIEEVGRMVGGWKKGLLAKTSAPRAEERRG